MTVQLSFTGDGTMAMNAGWQEGHVFVCFYDTGEPHGLDEHAPQPFKSTGEMIDACPVILNFTSAKSIDNLIATLVDAKKMLLDPETFERNHDCVHLDGDK